ncbi:hypothetical protein [Fluviicola sp.]|uniref:hypothetical protein n=1 Tax=Fluviicola sp. TaxID=1917219 RepID=UPI0031CF9719
MNDLLDEMSPKPAKPIRFLWWVALIWGVFFAIGYLFRHMHWPYGNTLKIISAGGFIAYAFSCFLLTKPRRIAVIACTLAGAVWISYVLWGVFFNDGHPVNFVGLMLQLISFAIFFLLDFGILFLVKKTRQKRH